MSDWDYYNDLLNDMKNVGRNLDRMLQHINECKSDMRDGLRIGGQSYKRDELEALKQRIKDNRYKVWEVIVPTLIDDMNSL